MTFMSLGKLVSDSIYACKQWVPCFTVNIIIFICIVIISQCVSRSTRCTKVIWIWDITNKCSFPSSSSKSLISIIHSSNSLSSCSSSLCKTSAITSSNDNFLCLLEQSAILLSTLKTSYHYWGHKCSSFLASIISKQTSMLVSSNSCVFRMFGMWSKWTGSI